MKKIIFVLLGLLVLFIIAGVIGINYLMRDLSETSEITIGAVDLSLVRDGTYEGTYENGRFTNIIQVTVENHTITSLVMMKDVTFVKDEVRDELFKQIIDSQHNDCDPIAGASVTCLAYLKAIENALMEGM